MTTYPDSVALVRTYLLTLPAFTGMTIASRVPAPRPARWLQLRLVTSQQQRPVRTGERLDVYAWGADEVDAFALGDAARAAIHSLAKTSLLGVPCYRVEETLGLKPSDDLETGAARTWATYALTLRADAAIA